MRLTFLLNIFSYLTFSQEKPIVFYNEGGEKINKQEFNKKKNNKIFYKL